MTKLEKLFELAHEVKEDAEDNYDLWYQIYYALKDNRNYYNLYAQSTVNGKYYHLYSINGRSVFVVYRIGHECCGVAWYTNTRSDHYADKLMGDIASNASNLYINVPEGAEIVNDLWGKEKWKEKLLKLTDKNGKLLNLMTFGLKWKKT